MQTSDAPDHDESDLGEEPHQGNEWGPGYREDLVEAIRGRLLAGDSRRTISQAFSISPNLVHAIKMNAIRHCHRPGCVAPVYLAKQDQKYCSRACWYQALKSL